MKNATRYEKKIKKLLTGLGAVRTPAAPDDPIQVIVEAVMERNAGPNHFEKAMAMIDREFVDLNELRVAQPREIVELLSKSFPWAREKAEEVTTALNKIFQRANCLDVEYMEQMAKRALRRHLEKIGLSPYAAARVVSRAFGGHAIPVDEDLAETLVMDGYVDPGASADEIQGFLERIVSQKDCLAAHVVMRRHIARRRSTLNKKRKAEAAARLAAERKAAEAAAKAAAKAAAEADAKKARAAERAAKAKAAEKAKKAKAAEKAKKAAARAKKAKAAAKAKKRPAKTVRAKAKKKEAKRPAAKKKSAKKKAVKKKTTKRAKKTSKKSAKASGRRQRKR